MDLGIYLQGQGARTSAPRVGPPPCMYLSTRVSPPACTHLGMCAGVHAAQQLGRHEDDQVPVRQAVAALKQGEVGGVGGRQLRFHGRERQHAQGEAAAKDQALQLG